MIRLLKKFSRPVAAPSEPKPPFRCGIGATVGPCRQLEGAEFISVGDYSNIYPGAWLGAFPNHMPGGHTAPPSIEIQNRVHIGFFACITVINSVVIENGSVISDYFYASDHTHGHDPRLGSPAMQPLISKGPVRISRNCFLGYRVTVLPGVTLGESCVVGAHSVVTKSFPAFTMLAGSPARPIKKFDFNEGAWMPVVSYSSC
jgi:lipopolysaccharide O-acetyltransferase